MESRGKILSGRKGSYESVLVHLYLLYTGGLFHCYMLDKSICCFRVVRSILWLLFYF